MTSDIIPASPLRLKQWEACKKRILDRLAALAEIEGKTIIEMLPDIRIIKENQLWKYGGYRSFGEFCAKALGVSRQYVYRVLFVNQDARNVLEMNDANPAQLTSGILDVLTISAPNEPQPEAERQSEKPLNDPPKPAKRGRKQKPKPEPIEATFTEPEIPSAAAVILGPAFNPLHPSPAAQLPDTANVTITTTDSTRVCPHCGGAI